MGTRKQLYEIAVLKHPVREGDGGTEVLVGCRHILATSRDEAQIVATRLVKTEDADRPDRLEVLVCQPFC